MAAVLTGRRGHKSFLWDYWYPFWIFWLVTSAHWVSKPGWITLLAWFVASMIDRFTSVVTPVGPQSIAAKPFDPQLEKYSVRSGPSNHYRSASYNKLKWWIQVTFAIFSTIVNQRAFCLREHPFYVPFHSSVSFSKFDFDVAAEITFIRVYFNAQEKFTARHTMYQRVGTPSNHGRNICWKVVHPWCKVNIFFVLVNFHKSDVWNFLICIRHIFVVFFI